MTTNEAPTWVPRISSAASKPGSKSEKKAAYRWRRRADANLVHKCEDHRLTSYEAIGEHLRITPARVRQLEAQAIKKIKAAMTTDTFFEEYR
jgi:DNA-directed RNA polymerase sigma subunit (sigma70/sigma32)